MFRGRLKWLAAAVFVAGFFSFVVLASTVKAETSYYRNAYWQCQDGVTSNQGGTTVCKSAETWNKEAETACASHCDKIAGKCGIAKYSVSNGCSLAKVCKETDSGTDKMNKGKNTIYNSNGTVFTTGEDFCYDKNTVTEFTCSNGQWDITYEKCGDGYACDLGACRVVAVLKPTCKDTDGGDSIFVKGTLDVYTPSYGSQTVNEYCVDKNGAQNNSANTHVEELVCLTNDSTYAYTHRRTECPYGCKDGACLATAPVSNTKADLGLYGFLQIGKNKREVKWNETITLTPDDMLWMSGGKVAFDLYYADKNYGSAKSGVYGNKIYFDNSLVSQQTNRQLEIGEKQDVWTQAYFSMTNGVHVLKFKVDADNQVVESSESNNEFVVYVKLSGFTSSDSSGSVTAPTTQPTQTTPTTPVVTYDLSAKPIILTPANNAILTNYPRKTDVRWTAITAASKYELEVACDYCGSSLWSSVNSWGATTNYFITPALAGDNQFRAKVKAIYPDGTSSQWSDYIYFKYNTSQYVTPAPTTSGGSQSTTVVPAPVVKPATPAKKPVGKMLCGNSAGGDGLYSACVNNTIKHNSKMNIKVRTYNNYYVWLTLSNADKKYYRIPVRKNLEIDRADGEMTIKITYTKRSAKYGVFLQVETTFDASTINPEEDVVEGDTQQTGDWAWKLATSVDDAYNFINGLGSYTSSHAVGSIAATKDGFYIFYRANQAGSNSWGWKLAPTEDDAYKFLNRSGGYSGIPKDKAELAYYKEHLYIFYSGEDKNASWGWKRSTSVDDMYKFVNGLSAYDKTRVGTIGGDTTGDILMLYRGDKTGQKDWGWKVAYSTDDAYNFLNGLGGYSGSGAVAEAQIYAIDSSAGTTAFYIFYRKGSVISTTPTAQSTPATSAVLPAYDETKASVGFGVGVNDYPDHKDYTKSKNLANAFVNVYTMILDTNGTFRVLSYETLGTGTGDNPAVKAVVKSGQMVYFEGFKTEAGAKAGGTKKMAQTWTTPPYKNFSSVNGKLCQTNYSKTDEFLGGTADYACANSLSTPYQD